MGSTIPGKEVVKHLLDDAEWKPWQLFGEPVLYRLEVFGVDLAVLGGRIGKGCGWRGVPPQNPVD